MPGLDALGGEIKMSVGKLLWLIWQSLGGGGGSGGITGIIVGRLLGANTVASGQVTASAVAGTLVAARSTRRQVTFKNTSDTSTVYISEATVTALKGTPLLAGESITVTGTILWQVIAPSGSPVVSYIDEYYS